MFTGETSSKLFRYKYADFAPSASAIQVEAQKRLRELHFYDTLWVARCLGANERKARIPFGNLDFMRYVIAIAPPPKSKAYTRTASTLSVWPFRTGTGFRMISSRGKRLPFVIMLDD